jgi:hypothetical protein
VADGQMLFSDGREKRVREGDATVGYVDSMITCMSCPTFLSRTGKGSTQKFYRCLSISDGGDVCEASV